VGGGGEVEEVDVGAGGERVLEAAPGDENEAAPRLAHARRRPHRGRRNRPAGSERAVVVANQGVEPHRHPTIPTDRRRGRDPGRCPQVVHRSGAPPDRLVPRCPPSSFARLPRADYSLTPTCAPLSPPPPPCP